MLDDEGEIQYIVVEMQTLDHIQRTYQDGLYEQREDFREEVKKDSSPFYLCESEYEIHFEYG